MQIEFKKFKRLFTLQQVALLHDYIEKKYNIIQISKSNNITTFIDFRNATVITLTFNNNYIELEAFDESPLLERLANGRLRNIIKKTKKINKKI